MVALGEKMAGFMGAGEDYQEAALVLLGVPMDFTTSFRPGTRTGPREIREVSYALEEYSPYQDRELGQLPFYDGGDLALPLGNVAGSLKLVAGAVERILGDGKFPLLLGGEHLLTLGAVAAARGHYPDLVVLQLDAHADLRDTYEGEKNSHATVMRRVAELVGAGNLYQIGIRSGTREELAYARRHTHLWPDPMLSGRLQEQGGPGWLSSALEEAVAAIGDRPVYVTLDIDLVDPAFAPGTGAPEPCGCTPRELLAAFPILNGLQVVGFDLVEVAPVYDRAQITSLLAAKLVREAILAFGAGFSQRNW
ncbi:MAG TPA: agmatinase [Firmicutes bacterium]|nr:agmatinase [Bacillota bacterium]